MTITQTIDIPADRRVRFDFKVPHEIPEGQTKIIIQFPFRDNEQSAAMEKPKMYIQKNSNGKYILSKEIIDEMLQDSQLKEITGILHTDMTLEEIREERLAKYL